MNKIYVSGNYLLIVLIAGPTKRFPQRDTTFNRNQADNGFLIQDRGRRSQEILDADLGLAGTWEDNVGVKYTVESLTTLLETSTGNFSAAPGGSGALTASGTISALTIRTGGYTEMLPDPAAGTYYSNIVLHLKFKFGTIPFNFPAPVRTGEIFAVGLNDYVQRIHRNWMNNSGDQVAVIRVEDGLYFMDAIETAGTTVKMYGENSAGNIGIGLYFGKEATYQATQGDSTIDWVVEYNLNEF